MKQIQLIVIALILGLTISAKEYHVAKTGNDNNQGELNSPLLTIQAAANLAQPGDIVIVHEGVYRERINPPRGGSSNDRRIVYQAAEGNKVEIKGSEQIKNWIKFSGTVWKATISNSIFGKNNPYKELIHGDWFDSKGRNHHTGEVHLNGKSFWEMDLLEKVLKSEPIKDKWDAEGSTYTWFCESDTENTYIYANFHEFDPNKELVEINVRSTCFYPESTGINFITIRNFHLSQAATQWAPPTAEQIGLIGTNWSKGWIIENNIIRNSKCSGITLGKYGDIYDNTSANSAEGYVETVKRALNNNWSKENIGSHILRNNTISDCEQTGICGSLGGVFSVIENNNIFNIGTKQQFAGAEMGGIKIHASIDMLIKGNRIVNCGKGIWVDWMAQGTRITSNLCYNNNFQDLYAEVNHGPYLVDNNLLLSLCSVWDMSQGGAYVHNLMAGKLNLSPQNRITPYHQLHSTQVAGYDSITGGDNRFINNIFIAGCKLNENQKNPEFDTRANYGKEYFGLKAFNQSAFPILSKNNVYIKGAFPYENEINGLELTDDPKVQITENKEGFFFSMQVNKNIVKIKSKAVTTKLLGETVISKQAYVNPDNSSIIIDKDFLGNNRNIKNPTVGPFELTGFGMKKIRVWK